MPIINVQVVGALSPEARQGLAARLANAAGRALQTEPGTTWIRLNYLAAEDYAESGGGPPRGVAPIFVEVLRRQRPPAPALAAEIAALAGVVATECGRPVDNVHVLYAEEAAGRIGFGGRLVPADQ